MNTSMARQSGYTLIELMVAVGMVAVLSAIALPVYNNYVTTSRVGALVNNIATIEVFEEDFRLRNGVYQPGVFNAGSGRRPAGAGLAAAAERRHCLYDRAGRRQLRGHRDG